MPFLVLEMEEEPWGEVCTGQCTPQNTDSPVTHHTAAFLGVWSTLRRTSCANAFVL